MYFEQGGRFAEGKESQTDPIKTIHLEPPVDQGDERPIDYRLELYVGQLKRSNMRAGRLFGVCQAIRDACKHNNNMDPKALMSLFRKTQKLSKRDPRLTLDVSNSSVVGTAYALPLLRHWYVEDNPSQRFSELEGYPVVKACAETEYAPLHFPRNCVFCSYQSDRICNHSQIHQDQKPHLLLTVEC